MENVRITFKVQNGAARLENAGACAVNAEFDGEKLTVRMKYDFKDDPLTLTADASEGDEADMTIRPYRIELRVNGALVDEEWPAGDIEIGSETKSAGDFVLTFEEVEPEKPAETPFYTRRGITADEIRLPGVNIGDCIPFSDDRGDEGDGLYHLFYLYDRHHHRSKWGLGAHQWAHVSTRDLKTWDEHPMAVHISEKYEGSICTGSIEYALGKYYAWYAVRMTDGSPARITCAVSDDSVHFTKTMQYFTLPSRYEPTSARDPKAVFLDGKLHLFVTTTLLESGNGCLAHLVSNNADMSDFTDCGPIIEHDNGDQPECPDWFKMGEYYYLIYSICGRARYVYSKNPFSDWTAPEDNIIPCGTVPKSAVIDGKRIFSGFICEDRYAGSLTMIEAIQNSDGTLSFTNVN